MKKKLLGFIFFFCFFCGVSIFLLLNNTNRKNYDSNDSFFFEKIFQKGLTLQKSTKFTEANEIFFSLLEQTKDSSFSRLKEDLLVALIINAFFCVENNNFYYYLTCLEKRFPSSNYLIFLNLLKNYKNFNYKKCLDSINTLDDFLKNQKPNIGSLISQFNFLFSPIIDLIQSNCLIETQDFAKARFLLNKALSSTLSSNFIDNKLKDLVLLLFAYSYFKEMLCSSNANIEMYYDIIIFYLKESSYVYLNHPIFNFPLEDFFNFSSLSIKNGSLTSEENISYVIHLIQAFPLDSSKNFIYNFLSKKTLSASFSTVETIFFSFPSLQEKILSSLYDLLKESILNEDIILTKNVILLIQKLDENHFSKKTFVALKEQLSYLLNSRNLSPYYLESILELSKGLFNENLISQLDSIFITKIQTLWEHKHYDEAFKFIKTIMNLKYFGSTKENILLFLCSSYKKAIAFQNFNLCVFLENTFQNLNLSYNYKFSEEEIANLIADAKHLYNQKSFSETILCCSWLSRIAPENDEIWELKGLSFFHLKYYSSALSCFQKLSIKKNEILVTISICQNNLSKNCSLQ